MVFLIRTKVLVNPLSMDCQGPMLQGPMLQGQVLQG
jgi:hypothetical protein